LENKEKLYTVGELAKRCGVTVRTLQYYDTEGLLSPMEYSEGGRRLYGREDIIRLHQILFLKSFGFSLEKIRDRMMAEESPKELARILSKQRDVILEQRKKLGETADFLSKVIDEIQKNGYLSTEKMVAIIGIMKTGSPYSFVLRYFDQSDMKTLSKWIDEESDQHGVAVEWQALFTEMTELYKKGTDPNEQIGQSFARRWWELVQESTGDDPGMMQTLIGIGNDIDNWPGELGEFKDAIKDFLSPALGKYLVDQGILPKEG